MRPAKRFSIYDAMEAAGAFASNPANTTSFDPVTGVGLYKGPVEYPKMFYHPKGKRRITTPAEVMVTPFGPRRNNEQSELIWQLANSPAEEAELRRQGWHDHPSDAIAAAGGEAPPKSAAGELEKKTREVEKLRAELEELKRQKAAGQIASDKASEEEED